MTDTQAEPRRGGRWLRWAPIAGIVIAVAALFATGAHEALTFENLRDNRGALLAFVAEKPLTAIAIYVGVYVLGTLTALPGMLWVTIAGGFLFGLWGGGALTWAAAVGGATALFLAARGAFADLLARQTGGWLSKLRKGFQENAFSYLLTLRLLPFAPYPVVNLAPAFLGVSTPVYVGATALGVIPAVFVYTSIGSGIGAVLDAGGTPDVSLATRPEVWGPLVGLALLALLPVAWKRFSKRGRPA